MLAWRLRWVEAEVGGGGGWRRRWVEEMEVPEKGRLGDL